MNSTRNSVGANISQECARTTQVDDQMNSIGLALDTLHAVAEELIHRLEIVTSAEPVQGAATMTAAGAGPQLVPLASRLSNVQARITYMTGTLRATLENLEL